MKINQIKQAFTLAEILLSLTVIGIVAAIALPSLLGNANERAWETQKKALYTRFSQSIPLLPSLNGYGKLEEVTNGDNTELVDTAAESFVRDGLSKVMKVTNICDSEHLSDCGLPNKIISTGGTTIELSSITTLTDFNPLMGSFSIQDSQYPDITYTLEQINSKAAAFETVNGESVLVYYNPYCQPYTEEGGSSWYYTQPKMCANFVYDLNGKKGPNTVGKDIGFITAMYSTASTVVAPNPYPTDLPSSIPQTEISAECRKLGEDMKAPNIDELTSMFYNGKLLDTKTGSMKMYWSTSTFKDKAWYQSFSVGRRRLESPSGNARVRCIKK